MMIFSTLRWLADVCGVGEVFKELRSVIVDIWEDPWVPLSPDFHSHPKNPLSLRENCKVADLIDEDSGSWNVALLSQLFDVESVNHILRIQWNRRDGQDVLVWMGSNSDDFMPSISSSLTLYEEWKFPPPGIIKLNVDAALGRDISFVGIVARDHFGKLIKCWTFKGPTAIPEVAEAFRMVKALEVAIVEGWGSIICEGDAQDITKAINGNPHSLS
ncbi:hypothetical protein TorRG33x02_315700 [Trema orientale]|uniref:RNase H type-1 domain-containing protein n=1 Tax=Trema orientale TaxID=63057 RepID=A0A2P5BMX9_TREOI|nr:hypothetical protein TorRG33x02_315700 [Trema orientale]